MAFKIYKPLWLRSHYEIKVQTKPKEMQLRLEAAFFHCQQRIAENYIDYHYGI